MDQRKISKITCCPRRPTRSAGVAYEDGEDFEVIGQREIGMLGQEPVPAQYYYLAFHGTDQSGKPLAVKWSDGSDWHEAKTIEEAKIRSGAEEGELDDSETDTDVDLTRLTKVKLIEYATDEISEEWAQDHKDLKKAELIAAIEDELEAL